MSEDVQNGTTSPLISSKIALEHLQAQYRLYREEVRMYLGFAAASAPLLIFLFMNELSVAKDNHDLIVLVPLTSLSYSALLGFLWTYGQFAALYSELIELKINVLLKPALYSFENDYVGPKPGKHELFPFGMLCLFIAAMPVLLTGYAMRRMMHDSNIPCYLSCGILALVVIGFPCIAWAVARLWRLKKKENDQLLEDWWRTWEGGREQAVMRANQICTTPGQASNKLDKA
jgi:hypothetical protein